MKVFINGENKNLPVNTLADVVDYYNLNENLIVTEVDGTIINPEDRIKTIILEGTKIEIVQFVGGG